MKNHKKHIHEWGLMWVDDKIVAVCINNPARVVTMEQLIVGDLPSQSCGAMMTREEIEAILNEREHVK